jgi:predicted negative regulator of RcsB-dependent stress response
VRAEVRHQLKEDRFRGATLQVAGEAAHWSVEHKGKLLVIAVIVLVIAGAAGGGWYYLNSQDEKASIDLSRALRTMETQVRPANMPAQPDVPSFASSKERATEAHKQFQGIVDKYPHTHSGDVARYFLGLTAADTGDYATAQRELGTVAAYHNAELSSLAKMGLASVYRQQGQNKQAIEIYKALSDKPTAVVSKATAQLELAAALMADRQPLEAKGIYERVQKENAAMPAAQIAAQALQELK